MKALVRQGVVGALLLAAVVCCLVPLHSVSQEASTKRKLLDHSAPAYPALARNLAIEGIVKLDALVAPDGTIKSMEVKGGHPVLAQAALNTVRNWRWEPAPRETHEILEIKFAPK